VPILRFHYFINVSKSDWSLSASLLVYITASIYVLLANMFMLFWIQCGMSFTYTVTGTEMVLKLSLVAVH